MREGLPAIAAPLLYTHTHRTLMESDALSERRIIIQVVFLPDDNGAIATRLSLVVSAVYKLAQTDARGLFRIYDVQVSQVIDVHVMRSWFYLLN